MPENQHTLSKVLKRKYVHLNRYLCISYLYARYTKCLFFRASIGSESSNENQDPSLSIWLDRNKIIFLFCEGGGEGEQFKSCIKAIWILYLDLRKLDAYGSHISNSGSQSVLFIYLFICRPDILIHLR